LLIASSLEAFMPLVAGQILNNRYRIVKILGQGGFGAVYRAWDTSLNGPCAVKENFDASPSAQKQFAREASLLFNLRHPNLPRVFDHFSIAGQGQYLVMDFVEGDDLLARVEYSAAPPSVGEVFGWLDQVCDALIYLHSQEPPIIHRDIKPSNIRLTPQGRAVLVDFGIAKQYDPGQRTTAGAQAVTPGFSPPEQYGMGNTDAQSDLYALAATAYFLFTGQVPPASVDVLSGSAPLPARASVFNPDLSPAAGAVIERGMLPNRTARTASVKDFRAALQAAQYGQGAPEATLISGSPPPELQPLQAPPPVAPTARPQPQQPPKPEPAAPQVAQAVQAKAPARTTGAAPRKWLAPALLIGLCLGLALLAGAGYSLYQMFLVQPPPLPAGPSSTAIPARPASATPLPPRPATLTPAPPTAAPPTALPPTALPPTSLPPADAPAPAKLEGSFSLWHSANQDTPDQALLVKWAAMAQDMYPGLKVELVYLPFDEMGKRLEDVILSGGGPDLVYYPNDYLGAWAEQKLISPLEPFSPAGLEAFHPSALEGMRYAGSLYGLPESSSNLALYYDQSQVAYPPANTDELLKLALDGKPLVQATGAYPLFPWSGAFGGRLLDESGRCIAAGDSGWIQSLYYLLDLQKAGGIFMSDYTAAETLFTSRKIPMFVNGVWALPKYQEIFGDRLGVAPIPSGPGGPASPLVALYGFYLGSSSPNPGGAVELARYFTSQAAAQLATEAGHAPVRIDVKPGDPALVAFSQAAASGLPRPKETYFDQFWGPFGQMYEQVLFNQVAPEKALEQACQAMNTANGK
jgi:arabinogalactan oligomer/maltooligosaccharide transport system substrate-binding protein